MVGGVNTVTILCRRLVIIEKNEAGLQWLIGSPFFSPFTIVSISDLEDKCTCGIEAVVAKFRNPRATYMLEALQECSTEAAEPILVRGSDLDVQTELMDERLSVGTPQESNAKTLCLYFCLKDKAVTSVENADKIQVDILFSASESSLKPAAPVAEYVPGEAKFMAVDYKLEVLCYAAKNLRLTHAVSKLIIPALADQLYTMKNMILPDILSRRPQLHPYHFNPPGFLHPITAIYELSYGEREMKQVEIRKALHLRLGLPFDRPLLRIASAMNFSTIEASKTNVPRKGTPLLKNVHIGIPGSGVTGGLRLWFKVLMSTIITFKVDLMTR